MLGDGSTVRITGWILLLAGVVLCVSVAWAALGFLLMGIGLVALQVAEQNRRRAKLAAAAVVPDSVGVYLETMKPPRAEQPVVLRDVAPTPEPEPLPAPAPARRVARRAVADTSPYDRAAWRRLVESDSQISQLAAVLADFGQNYVDEFATSYLADPDKSRLGAIMDGIIAKASASNRPQAAAPTVESKPAIVSRPEPEVADTDHEFDFDLFADPAPTPPPPASKPSIVARPEPEPPRSGDEFNFDLLPAPTRPLPETEDALIAAMAALTAAPVASAKAPVPVDPPKLHREPDAIPLPAADDDLSEMIKKFAPDSSFLRKG